MLTEGKISVAEADRLLDKLASSGRQAEGDAGNAAGDAKGSKPTPKFLRVEVDANDPDRVNIRVPMFLVRTSIKLSTMLPSKVSRKLTEKGIDLSQLSGLDGDELVQALARADGRSPLERWRQGAGVLRVAARDYQHLRP